MEEERIIEHLQEYIYKMFHLKNKDVYHPDNLLENRKIVIKDLNKQKDLVEILGWAVDRPGYDFISILPVTDYSNEEIYYYLKMEHEYRLKVLKDNNFM